MTVTQAGSGTSGPTLARFSGVTNAANLRTGTYSMACRVRWGTSATNVDMMLMTLTIQSDGRGFYIQRRSGDPSTTIIVYRYNGFLTFNTASLTGAYGSTTDWVHIGAVYDGSTIRTYLNGVAGGTVASTNTLIAAGTTDAISVCGPVTADVADAVMFSRALSAAEMAELAGSRQPKQRLADCFCYVPMIETSSLTNAGIDYSGTGNHCTLQSSGANNPAASNISVPEPWSGPAPLIVLRQGPIAIDGTGASNVAGSAALSEAVALTRNAAQVSVASSAAISEAASLTGTGGAGVAGSAAVSVATALVGAGAVSVAASATESAATALVGSGSSSVAGAALVGEAAALVGSGASAVAGSAAESEAVALTGSGQAATAGTSTLSAGFTIDGTGATSAAASGTVAEGVALQGAGAVATAASATLDSGQVQIDGAGSSSVASSAALSEAAALTGAGATSAAGSAALSESAALTGAGAAQVAGAAAVSSAVARTGQGDVSVAGSGLFSLGQAIDGTGAARVAGSATVLEQASFAASGGVGVSAAATLSVAAALTGSGQVTVAAFGTVTGGTPTPTGRGNSRTNAQRRQMYLGRRLGRFS